MRKIQKFHIFIDRGKNLKDCSVKYSLHSGVMQFSKIAYTLFLLFLLPYLYRAKFSFGAIVFFLLVHVFIVEKQ